MKRVGIGKGSVGAVILILILGSALVYENLGSIKGDLVAAGSSTTSTASLITVVNPQGSVVVTAATITGSTAYCSNPANADSLGNLPTITKFSNGTTIVCPQNITSSTAPSTTTAAVVVTGSVTLGGVLGPEDGQLVGFQAGNGTAYLGVIGPAGTYRLTLPNHQSYYVFISPPNAEAVFQISAGNDYVNGDSTYNIACVQNGLAPTTCSGQ